MNKKVLAIVINLAVLPISHVALATQSSEQPVVKNAAAQPTPPEDMERVVVYGQKTRFELKKEILSKTKDFFKDYNKINPFRQFDMVCLKSSTVGTNFKSTKCEPQFIRSNRTRQLHAIAFAGEGAAGDGPANDDAPSPFFLRLSVVSHSGKLFASQDKKFQANVNKLMEENPELLARYHEIMDLQEELEYKKKNR